MSPSARRWLAEVLGTYVLVLFGSMAILAGTERSSGTQIIVVAFGFGLALLAGLYAFGEVSGGHYNPAVSLAMLIDGRMSVADFAAYVVAQVGGALLGSITVLAASSREAVATTNTVLGPNVEAWEGFLLEALFTAFFLAVVLKVTTSASNAKTAFIGISFTLVVIYLALVPFTGASVNPARSIGPALVGDYNADLWIYVIAPLVGAVIGWVLYKAVTTGSEEKSLE